MTFLQQLASYWGIIAAVVGVIVWLARLEFKVLANDKDIENMKTATQARDKESDGFREKILITLENLTVNMEYVKKSLEDLKRK